MPFSWNTSLLIADEIQLFAFHKRGNILLQAYQCIYYINFSFIPKVREWCRISVHNCHNSAQYNERKHRVRPQICRDFVLCATLACANVLQQCLRALPAARNSNNDRIAATKPIAICRTCMLHGVCARCLLSADSANLLNKCPKVYCVAYN